MASPSSESFAGTGLVVRIASITRMAEPHQYDIARLVAPMTYHMWIGVIEQDGLALDPQQPSIGHLGRVVGVGNGGSTSVWELATKPGHHLHWQNAMNIYEPTGIVH